MLKQFSITVNTEFAYIENSELLTVIGELAEGL